MNNYDKFENDIIKDIKAQYKLNIEEACFASGWIPKHIILDRTRNIHSYIIFTSLLKKHFCGRYFSKPETFYENIIQLVRTQYSKLDRPLFILTTTDQNNFLCIEGNVIREYMLTNSSEKNIMKYVISELKSFDEIVKIIKIEL